MEPSQSVVQLGYHPQPADAEPSKAPPPAKPPLQRGARACRVCRQAKMKCVGADEGSNGPCQRCKRSGAECIFDKHRRGRKPGSKLSEASKMLRRLEKGLSTAKAKQVTDPAALPSREPRSPESSYHRDGTYSPGNSRYNNDQLSPLHSTSEQGRSGHSSRSDNDMDEDDDDQDRGGTGMFPANVIRKENQNQRNSFLGVVLNQDEPQCVSRPVASSDRSQTLSTTQSPRTPSLQTVLPLHTPPLSTGPSMPKDPIAAGLIDESEVLTLFDMFYLRLNPFINLFDPELHSVAYVRHRCPFLFTVMIMAGCKFFKPDLYQSMMSLSREFAKEAFCENRKSVEVVQAFACLTYWKEPGDQRTWTYIGYACRMAVELGLNRYVAKKPYETELQKMERRNRERTYLVLWVHDRSLCMQTGKHWMLPEDELVLHSLTWPEDSGGSTHAEDVIVSAFVHLRRIASETLDNVLKPASHGDHDIPLKNCNDQLDKWLSRWHREMEAVRGESFHFSFLTLFQLSVRLFLNFMGINSSMAPGSRTLVNVDNLDVCYRSATATLKIVSEDFASMNVLRYGQESITVNTAYSAIVLLKLLRNNNTARQLREHAVHEVHSMITKAADAYHAASVLSPPSSSALHHSRFLHWLVDDNIQRLRQMESRDRYAQSLPLDTRGQAALPYPPGSSQAYPPPPPTGSSSHADRHVFHYPSSGFTYPAPTSSAISSSATSYSLGPQYRDSEYSSPSSSMRNSGWPQQSSAVTSYSPHPASFPSEPDAQYASNMLHELGSITSDSSEWPLSLGYQGPGPENANLAVPGFGGPKCRDYPRIPSFSPYSATPYQYPVLGSASFSQTSFGSGR